MKPSDRFEKQDHPYDNGYWAAYDGEPMPSDHSGRLGWLQAKADLWQHVVDDAETEAARNEWPHWPIELDHPYHRREP